MFIYLGANNWVSLLVIGEVGKPYEKLHIFVSGPFIDRLLVNSLVNRPF